MTDLAGRVSALRSEVHRRCALKDRAEFEVKRIAADVEDLTRRSEQLTNIASFLNSFADERQEELHRKIESVVTAGVRKIFEEDDMSLKIVSKMVGQRNEIDFVLVSGELETSILEARGGGVAAVVGFLIQAVLVMLTPHMRPVLFLDETFAQVSDFYRPALGAFLHELATEGDLQIVMVTHDDVYREYADKVYKFTQTAGVTKVVEDDAGF